MGFVVNGALEPCWSCGQNDSYLFDAYSVGDRLMEGVIFKYSFDGADLVVEPTSDAEKYLSRGMDREYWIREVYDYLKTHMGHDSVLCPKCGEWFC